MNSISMAFFGTRRPNSVDLLVKLSMTPISRTSPNASGTPLKKKPDQFHIWSIDDSRVHGHVVDIREVPCTHKPVGLVRVCKPNEVPLPLQPRLSPQTRSFKSNSSQCS